jgi:hypothetical protein
LTRLDQITRRGRYQAAEERQIRFGKECAARLRTLEAEEQSRRSSTTPSSWSCSGSIQDSVSHSSSGSNSSDGHDACHTGQDEATAQREVDRIEAASRKNVVDEPIGDRVRRLERQLIEHDLHGDYIRLW